MRNYVVTVITYRVESSVRGYLFDEYRGDDREKAFAVMESVWKHCTDAEKKGNYVQIEEGEIGFENPISNDEADKDPDPFEEMLRRSFGASFVRPPVIIAKRSLESQEAERR